MKQKEFRPLIDIHRTLSDIIVEVLTIIVIFLLWMFTIYFFSKSPQILVSHFDIHGKPDGYSSKYFLFFMPSLASALTILLFFLNRFPHKFNYLETVTEVNAEQLYRKGTRLIRYINLGVSMFLSFIQFVICQSVISQQLPGYFILIILIPIVLTPLTLPFLLASKSKKKINSNKFEVHK